MGHCLTSNCSWTFSGTCGESGLGHLSALGGFGKVLAYDSEAVADVDGHGVEDLLLAVDDLADGVLAGGAGGDVGLEVALDGDGHVGAAVTQVSTCTYSKLA